MKKIILFIFVMLIVTGCSVSKLHMDNIDTMVDVILSKNVNLYNRISNGYKYYLPRGVRLSNYEEFNEVLYTNTNTYYLYVDIVSYHYKKSQERKQSNSSYYHRDLKNNGYIDISKNNDKYYISYYYNYAKMESIVREEQIANTVKDMTYILSSINYNDLVIDTFIGENNLKSDTKKYTIKKPKENDQTFLDYINTYDNYKENEIMEDDIDNETIKNNTVDDNESTVK